MPNKKNTQQPTQDAESKPFAHFRQFSSFGQYTECKAGEEGAFPAFRVAQGVTAATPAPGEAKTIVMQCDRCGCKSPAACEESGCGELAWYHEATTLPQPSGAVGEALTDARLHALLKAVGPTAGRHEYSRELSIDKLFEFARRAATLVAPAAKVDQDALIAGPLTLDQIRDVAINYGAFVGGDVYDITKYECVEDFVNCVNACAKLVAPAAKQEPIKGAYLNNHGGVSLVTGNGRVEQSPGFAGYVYAAPAAPLTVPRGWKLMPPDPTPQMIADAAVAVWPTASAADIELARQAAPLVLMKMDMGPGETVETVAATLATMVPAYRAHFAAAPAAPSSGAGKEGGA